MTTQTETVKAPANETGSSASGVTAGFIITLGVSALVSWVAGVALHQGFGVPVPFMAAWLLILAFLFLVKTMVRVAADAWYGALIEATPRLVASETVTATVTEFETQRLLDGMAFQDIATKIRGE